MRADRGCHRYDVDGWEILAGRSSRDNDYLTFKIAAANDWWFHLSGQPGSHVVLRVPDGAEPPKSILRAAAAIAAYHSKAKNAGTVAVSATLAKHVSKPRGAPAGQVSIRKETKIKVKPGLPEGSEDD